MTKKKALMYLVIFVVLVTITQIWKMIYLNDPAEKLPDACKLVISPACQNYINKITAEKKYDETVKIQQIRIKENEKVLRFFKSKIKDKSLMKMSSKEADEKLLKCIDTPECKQDYFLIKTADFTIRDILVDSFAVSQIQYSELKDKKSAQKTLKKADMLIKKNVYFERKEDALKMIEKEMSELK